MFEFIKSLSNGEKLTVTLIGVIIIFQLVVLAAIVKIAWWCLFGSLCS